MKKAVVVCILVVLLACMWSSVAFAVTRQTMPEITKKNWIGANLGGSYRIWETNGEFYLLDKDIYGPDDRIASTDIAQAHDSYNGTGWSGGSPKSVGTILFDNVLVLEGNCPIYADETLTTVYLDFTPGPPEDTTHYIMIGAIPHQLTIYESILVDTNWDYIKVVLKDGSTVAYQEMGPTSSYSQPFSDGRLNVPLAYMGLQDGVTYVFEVYGSEDGETWWDAEHPYKMTTTFTFYHSEADEVRVMGITDEKTYPYAPMVSWRKSGKYRNETLRVVLNAHPIYEGNASNGYVNLAYLPAEHKDFLSVGKGAWNRNTLTVIVEQSGDDYVVGSWNFWVNNDIMDMWNDNEDQPLPGVIDWDSDDSIIEQIKNTGQEAIQVVKVAFDFVPPEIMLLIILGFTLVIALRILGR